MAERPDTPEGWHVPQRPAVYGAAVTVATLLLLLSIAGYLYNHNLRQATWRAPTSLPSPGLDTAIHPGAGDPYVAARPVAPDPGIAAAKRRIAAQGLPGWESRQ